jgi:hypothetical protein
MRIHRRDDLGERRRPGGMGLSKHPERDLGVTLGGALVVGLAEALGRDQPVLELGGVAVAEGIPVGGSVDAPERERTTGRRGRSLELAGEGRRALHVDRDHRPVAGNVVGEDPQQRGRLAGTARAQDQAVSRQLLV